MKKRKIHEYVTKNDALILEKLFTWWKPSEGTEALVKLLLALEGDFAKRVAWSLMAHDCEQMSSNLMREVQNDSK